MTELDLFGARVVSIIKGNCAYSLSLRIEIVSYRRSVVVSCVVASSLLCVIFHLLDIGVKFRNYRFSRYTRKRSPLAYAGGAPKKRFWGYKWGGAVDPSK